MIDQCFSVQTVYWEKRYEGSTLVQGRCHRLQRPKQILQHRFLVGLDFQSSVHAHAMPVEPLVDDAVRKNRNWEVQTYIYAREFPQLPQDDTDREIRNAQNLDLIENVRLGIISTLFAEAPLTEYFSQSMG